MNVLDYKCLHNTKKKFLEITEKVHSGEVTKLHKRFFYPYYTYGIYYCRNYIRM